MARSRDRSRNRMKSIPLASQTETSLKRSVDSLTILIRALALRLCWAIGSCLLRGRHVRVAVLRQSAQHTRAQRASVVRQYLDGGANCLTLAKNVGKHVVPMEVVSLDWPAPGSTSARPLLPWRILLDPLCRSRGCLRSVSTAAC